MQLGSSTRATFRFEPPRDNSRTVGNPEVTSYEHPIGNGKFAHSEVSTT